MEEVETRLQHALKLPLDNTTLQRPPLDNISLQQPSLDNTTGKCYHDVCPEMTDMCEENFLLQQLSVCAEMEARREVLEEVMGEAEELMGRLGLQEKRRLQRLLEKAQKEAQELGVTAANGRKLMKSYTEHAHILRELGRVEQAAKKAMTTAFKMGATASKMATCCSNSSDCTTSGASTNLNSLGAGLQNKGEGPLLASRVNRQLKVCINTLSSLGGQQSELRELWQRARELEGALNTHMTHSTNDASHTIHAIQPSPKPTHSTLERLQQVETTLATYVHSHTLHLQRLQKALIGRRHLQQDINKLCDWLKQAEELTFAQVAWSASEEHLGLLLKDLARLQEQGAGYESLLMMVMRAGGEVLEELGEERRRQEEEERRRQQKEEEDEVKAEDDTRVRGKKKKRAKQEDAKVSLREQRRAGGEVLASVGEEVRRVGENEESRTGEEVLASLEEEQERSYLEELLHTLPERYSRVLVAAKQRQQEVQQVLEEKRRQPEETQKTDLQQEQQESREKKRPHISEQLEEAQQELSHVRKKKKKKKKNPCTDITAGLRGDDVTTGLPGDGDNVMATRDDIISRLQQVERSLADFTTATASSDKEADSKLLKHKALVVSLGSLKGSVEELRGGSCHGDAESLWQRWTCLHNATRRQQRALQHTAQQWSNLNSKVERACKVFKELQSVVVEAVIPGTSCGAALESLLQYQHHFCSLLHTHTASLEILRYMANDLMPPLQAPVDPQSAAQEDHVHIISGLLERCNRLLEQVCVSGAQVQRELQERRSVCEELRLVWSFVRDIHTLTLSPNADLDTLIIDLEAAREEVCVQKRRVESVCGHQQLKYETLQTHTPKELHTLLSHSALALDAAEKQVSMREEEVACVREMREECVCRGQLLLQEFRSLDTRLQNSSNTHTLEEAQVEHQRVCEDLERCSRTLEELRVCVKEMGGAEQNKTLLLQLRHTLTRLDNAHTHTAALAEDRSTHLIKAEQLMQEFRHSCRQIENWAQEAESVAASNITCSQSEKLQRNIHTYQSVLRRGVELCVCVGVLDGSVCELSGVLDTTRLRQQRAALRQRLHQLQHTLTHTLHDMKEAAQDVSQLEKHVKVLRVRLEETQGALTCPELARASLRQQLAHRQVLLREMGEVLEECEELQRSVCVLRLPEQQEECVCSEECLCEEVCVSASPLCNNTHSLQGETRRLTHSLIQQCNILQEAVLQQEQYEQEVMSLQRLVDDAQRLIHHQQVTPGNAQTSNHEELSRRIAGYQREIWALSSRSKMLGVKAKHTSMMLALREEVQGLEEEVMEEHREEAIEEEMEEEEEEEEEEEMTRHPSVVMMTAGRCHTLLSPVTEESGEEGTNSEVSSPPACRSPSPTDQGSSKASRAPPSEASDPESSITHTHLDGLQRSWDTIKNVMRYQETLQCVSAKMEAMEAELNQPLDQSRSPQSQMASHQALLDELLLLQEEMLELQECLSEDLHGDAPEGAEQQQAVQSTLTVLAERLATIRMKASGKRQLLEERLSEQLEEQRQEQALQRCHTEAEELDHWLLSTRQSLSSALQPRPQEIDMEEQLIDCQDMLVEIERKVWCLSELSVHSENLFMEGRGQTRGEAGLLSTRLQGLKASLLDLQRILQDKLHQGSLLQQQEDSGLSDSSLSQSPALHDWLSQSASSRGQQQHHMQRHREQEGDLSEQKKLLQSVANRGEELLTQKTTPTRNRQPEEQKSPLANQSGTALSQEQLLIRCKALRIDMRTKLQLSLDASSKHTPVCVYSRVSCPGSGFRRELTAPDCPSPKTLLKTASQSLKEKQVGGTVCVGQLCAAVRAASFWCDAAETRVLTGPMLHTHDTEMQLYQLEALAREVCEVDEEVRACRQVLRGGDAGGGEGGEAEDMEETLRASGGPMEEEVKDRGAEVTEMTANGDGLTDDRMQGGERLMTETQDGEAKLKEGDASLMEQTLRAGEETGRGGSRRSEEVKEGGTEEEEVMEEVLDVLHQRLELLSNSITPRSQQLTHTLQQCSTLQEELQQLSSALSESRKQLQQKLIGLLDSPAPRQAESVAEAEECVREFEARVEEMRSRADALQPDQTTTQELHRVQECYEELLCVVGCVRGRACVGEGMRCVCERLLGDLRELMDTAQDKMAAEMKLNANTVTDVHTLLDTHKEFFGVVEQHVYLTEAWLGAWSGQLRNVGSQWQLERNAGSQSDLAAHWEAIGHAHNILKQAHKRGMELETILEAWTGVSKDYEEVCATLEKVESSIPTAALVEETQERITHRINLYQRLKSTLSGRQQQLYSVLEDGKRLLLSVCCSDLETQLNQLGERWLHTHTRLNKEIQRLDATLTHWSRYERESADLSQWLRSALERLDFWNTQSVTVPQELELVRDHLHAFLEFSKDVDAHSEQQRAVMSLGAQVLRLKRVDTATLRSHMTEMDTQWSTLNTRIPHVQEKLHQLQMDKLSSCEAVAEVMSWISVMENSIQQEQQSIMGAVGSEAVRHFLNKYKGLRLELSCKQLTVDCVNGSVLQVSSLDVETKRSSRTHFAERLGTMNRHWSLLNTLVTEKIQVLESLLEKWEEHETGVSTLGAWLSNQEEKLNSRQRLEDITSVQNALKDTQELEVCMRDRSAELSRLEDSANQLMKDKSPDASTAVMETLTGLKQMWASLEKMVSDVKTELKRVCETWGVYRRVCEDIGGYLIEGRYSIARLRQLTCSPHATHAQVESLEALQRELETQEGSLAKLGSTTHTLLELAHPSVAHTLTHTLSDLTLRWNNLLEQVSDQLKSARALLLLWERYDETLTHTQTAVTHHEKDAHTLLRNSSHTHNVTGEEVLEWIHTCNELLASQEGIQERLQELQEAANQLQAHTLVPPIAMTMHHAHFLSLSQRLATSQAALSKQLRELQGVCEEVHEWEEQLDSLTETLDETLNTHTQQNMEDVKAHISVLIGRSPDLERLNERSYTLALSDTHTHTPRLQSLNRRWNTHSAHTLETYSALQGVCAQQQSFREKCESWMELLDSAERQLTPSISASYANLVEEQKQHEMFQAEVFSKQQILFSIISDGHSLLYHVQDREDFIQQMAQLSHEWQAVVHRCQRRRGLVEGLLWQWDRYRHLLETTRRYLDNASPVPLPCYPDNASSASAPALSEQQVEPIALQQARVMLHHIQVCERSLKRQQGGYILAMEAGRQLLHWEGPNGEETLLNDVGAELAELQEQWRSVTLALDARKRQLHALLKEWERCERAIAASQERLCVLKRKLALPLPEHHDELHTEQIHCKELEASVSERECVLQVCELKETLSSKLRPHDLIVLSERIDLLNSQWEEVSHQVCVRRAQVCERLNEWAVFNEKSKELCDWLTQMEAKVSQNADISIQDMIDKLRKEYNEEMCVAEENRHQLQEMGERLASASQPSKANEIQYKLNKMAERWQHLVDLIAARVKKLKETLLAVQQLDKNMSSLRSWLAHIETELSRPIIYQRCDPQEIQHKLEEQQELQRDIEKHSAGMASVLCVCEVLLHDCDACASESECDSIQNATRHLDRRWRNICAIAMERRLKIEETGRLWNKFLDDFGRFEEWLKASERTAARPNSSNIIYTLAKEELKKFEAFQRQVQECLTQLELINKQYRRLARENRTDATGRLKDTVHDGNRRWDALQRRVAAILRRLRHFIAQREEFESNRDSMLVWLTEMDLQLTNIEHFSECDTHAKIKQLRAFQQEMCLNAGRLSSVFHQGEALLCRCEPLDAAVIEEELEELRRYCMEVFGRVERYYRRLTRLPEYEDDLDESSELADLQLDESSHTLRTPQRPSDRDRDTPLSIDSLPLEWDHDFDLEPCGNISPAPAGGSTMRRNISSTPPGGSIHPSQLDVVIPDSPEGYIRLTHDTLMSSSGDLGHQDTEQYLLQQTGGAAARMDSSTPEPDSPYMGYMRLMGDGRGSSEPMRTRDEEEEEDEALSTDTAGVVRVQSREQPWQQLSSELESLEAWLSGGEEGLNQLRRRGLGTGVNVLQHSSKKLRELQEGMDSLKPKLLSINLRAVGLLQSGAEDEQQEEVKRRLQGVTRRFEEFSCSLEEFRRRTQAAIMQCQEFHESSHALLLWLEEMDYRRKQVGPISPLMDTHTLNTHIHTLTDVLDELKEGQQRVDQLQELSNTLLQEERRAGRGGGQEDMMRGAGGGVEEVMRRGARGVEEEEEEEMRRAGRGGEESREGRGEEERQRGAHTQEKRVQERRMEAHWREEEEEEREREEQEEEEVREREEARERVHVISSRLRTLMREVTSDLKLLHSILTQQPQAKSSSTPPPGLPATHPRSTSSSPLGGSTGRAAGGCVDSSAPLGGSAVASARSISSGPLCGSTSTAGRSTSSRPEGVSSAAPGGRCGDSFFLRVLRAALPLQLLLLLLLALVCLVPFSHEDYSCHHANNFKRSFHPMLRYTNGPPPI
ncbi:nesprin-1-like isoform X4 [Engraulis encrasicolus]|uniref:nesprin-1-like isoform X4 n=1 Tax=Engraulis encrasicolus TaxID=184585 RepID=UPI002FD5EC87